MSNVDLEDVIMSAVEDSVTPDAPVESEVVDTPVEESTEQAVEATSEATEAPVTDEVVPESTAGEIASPAAKAAALVAKPEQDDFEKKYGIPKESSPGRENRIPYSRMTKIVAKAVKDTESTFTPRIQEFETKIKEYEAKQAESDTLRQEVETFGQVMMKEQSRFVAYLKTLPGYAELLEPKGLVQTPTAAKVQEQAPLEDEMPQPEHKLDDGTYVYSMDGLRKRDEWNRAQMRKETLAEIEKTYGPIAQSYEEAAKERAAFRYQKEVLEPAVNAQIQEAYTWPLFKENEEAITKFLNANPKWNLERAYQAVVLPKLQANKDEVRKQILAELKKAPIATSAPATGSRPTSTAIKPNGQRDLEDVIREAAAGLPQQ